MDNILNEFLAGIVGDYFSEYGYEPLKLAISLADDIWDEYLKVRPDHKQMLDEQRPLPSFHGTIATPVELDGTFTIIIDNQYSKTTLKENPGAWIGTIIHELTHTIDYRDYARLVHAASYDEILDTSRHRMFQLWTEFNARRHGYYFLRKYTFKDVHDLAQIPDIVNRELPFQMNCMYEQYHSTSDGWTQMYTVSQFLGRLAVWEDLFPSHFDSEQIRALLGANRWMLEMYSYLNSHRDLEVAVQSFDELRQILLQNFQGL